MIQTVQTSLITVFLKLRISYHLPVANQEIHSVSSLYQGLWIHNSH